MKIYDETKTEILKYDDLDLSNGYLKDDVLITHIDEIEPVEEVGHYEIVKEYPNGGKDMQWIVDVEKVDGVEEHDEEEQIQVYIKYSKEYIEERDKEIEINKLKSELSNTDYLAIKYFEGWITEEEYEPIKQQREEIREKIRKLRK